MQLVTVWYMLLRIEVMRYMLLLESGNQSKNKGSIQYIQGNAMDNSFLLDVLRMQEWDCILDFMSYKTEQFVQRVEPFLNSTKQYIFLSSARVYDFDKVIDEESDRIIDTSHDTRFLCTKDYALEKARQEDVLRKQGKNNWTIVRPYKTYSCKRLQLGFLEKENWLYRCLQGRTEEYAKNALVIYVKRRQNGKRKV